MLLTRQSRDLKPGDDSDPEVGRLVITQTRKAHEAIEEFIEQLDGKLLNEVHRGPSMPPKPGASGGGFFQIPHPR